MEAAKKIFTRAHIIWFLLLNFGLVLLAAGTLAVWLTRRCPRAHAWLAAALVLDAAGLMMSMSGWPVSHELAAQLHTLLCSITLPMGLGALTCTQDE